MRAIIAGGRDFDNYIIECDIMKNRIEKQKQLSEEKEKIKLYKKTILELKKTKIKYKRGHFMSNKEFFNMFKDFIIEQCIEYKNEDLWIYYEILKQYESKGEIQEMIHNCNNILNIRYDIPDKDNYGTDGTIIIDADNGVSYEIILCCYGTYSINIKKIDYYDILTFNESKYDDLQQEWLNDIEEIKTLHIQNEINTINKEMNELAVKKKKLEKKLDI